MRDASASTALSPPRARARLALAVSARGRARGVGPHISVSGALAAALSLPPYRAQLATAYGVGLTAGPFFASLQRRRAYASGSRTTPAHGAGWLATRVAQRMAAGGAADAPHRLLGALGGAGGASGPAAARAALLASGGVGVRLKMENSARAAVLFTFVLSVSVGIAVTVLLGWHIYLVLSAQTTIEFYGNQTRKLRALVRGQRYHIPYDHGARANYEFVFGPLQKRGVVQALFVPSWRPPPWPCLLYTSPSPRDRTRTRMPSSA